jgi:ABC-type multidrug transport system permease subunit
MLFVLLAAAKDLRRRLSDPAAMIVWVGIPLALTGLMNLVSGSGGTTPRATVLLVDQDNTVLSVLLSQTAGGGSLVDLLAVALAEGERRIGAGEASALVVVPKGFQDSVINETPTEIRLVTNPAEQILPSIVQEALEIGVEAVFYAQRLFGPILRQIVEGAPSGQPADADVAAISVAINQQIARLQGVLVPPAIALEVATEDPEAARPSLSFGQLFLPGMLFMSFLFIASGMAMDVWEEDRLGTLRRMLTTPQSEYRLLAGKLVGGVVLMVAIAGIALLGAVAMFDVSWVRVPGAIAWSAFAGAALLAMTTLLQMLASSQRVAEMLSTSIIFPLMMIGGSFFPFESMPDWMAAVGQWTPNGLSVVRLKDLLYGAPSASAFIVSAAAIGVPALVAFVLAGRLLRRKFSTP